MDELGMGASGPVIGMRCGLEELLSTICNVAGAVPQKIGYEQNCDLTVAFTVRVDPQVFAVCRKLLGFAPVMEIPED